VDFFATYMGELSTDGLVAESLPNLAQLICNVDLERRQLSLLKTKPGKPRHIPINTSCLLALKQLQARPLSKDYVFVHEDGSRLIGHRWFEEAAKGAGLDICCYEATLTLSQVGW
jgi:integrase